MQNPGLREGEERVKRITFHIYLGPSHFLYLLLPGPLANFLVAVIQHTIPKPGGQGQTRSSDNNQKGKNDFFKTIKGSHLYL